MMPEVQPPFCVAVMSAGSAGLPPSPLLSTHDDCDAFSASATIIIDQNIELAATPRISLKIQSKLVIAGLRFRNA